MENGRHGVFHSNIDALNPKNLLEQLDVVVYSFKYAAELNLAFGFVLKNVEDGCFRYHYEHEKKTLLDRTKLVASTEDLEIFKNILGNPIFLNNVQENEPTQNGKITG